MAPFLLLHRLLLFLCAGVYTSVTSRCLCWARHPRRLSAGFLGTVPPRTWPISLAPSNPIVGKDPASVPTATAANGLGVSQGVSSEAPLLTFVDWGRGPTAPGSSEELVYQQQLQNQQRNRGSNQVCGLLYCTSWDPRSKAIVSALKLLQQDATRATAGPHIGEGEEPHLPQYPILVIRVTNSLIIARGRRALAKQRRMACNMKQLRHNERALRFMLQQQPPLQLRGLPALQLYAHRGQHQECDMQECEAACTYSMQQILEIRSLGPLTLKQLGGDERSLLGAWGPHGPPGGPPEVGILGTWLRRLGQLYEAELKQIVEERLQQAEAEYPIYTSYSP